MRNYTFGTYWKSTTEDHRELPNLEICWIPWDPLIIGHWGGYTLCVPELDSPGSCSGS